MRRPVVYVLRDHSEALRGMSRPRPAANTRADAATWRVLDTRGQQSVRGHTSGRRPTPPLHGGRVGPGEIGWQVVRPVGRPCARCRPLSSGSWVGAPDGVSANELHADVGPPPARRVLVSDVGDSHHDGVFWTTVRAQRDGPAVDTRTSTACGPRGTRTHTQRIKRIPILGDQSLYQQLRPQRLSTPPRHVPAVDILSHHDPHHAPVNRLASGASPRTHVAHRRTRRRPPGSDRRCRWPRTDRYLVLAPAQNLGVAEANPGRPEGTDSTGPGAFGLYPRAAPGLSRDQDTRGLLTFVEARHDYSA